ncbi:MAG: VCBS repeat-containing protein, partial [Flavobacteriales bacterium]|nr:VCBS repeat-containing protein [Flavobacteriales bacterium]
MKQLILPILFLHAFAALSQEFPNPFEDNIVEFNLEDILIIRTPFETDEIVQEVYGYDWVSHYAGQSDNLITSLSPASTLENTLLGSQSYIAATSGRFNDDSRDDVFYVLESDEGIRCTLNNLSAEFVEADSTYDYELSVPNSYLTLNNSANSGVPKIAVGDFDADGNVECAVSWWEPELDLIHIQVLDSDNTLTLEARAFTNDISSLQINDNHHAYDLTSADLNGDGADELVLIGIETSMSGNANYQVFVQVYEINNAGCQIITPKAYLVLDDENLSDSATEPDCDLSYAQTSATGVRRNQIGMADGTEDIIAGFALRLDGGDSFCNYENIFQFLVRSNEDLDMLEVITQYSDDFGNVFYSNYPLEAKTGDLNGDGFEDVVLLTDGGKMFSVLDDVIEYQGGIGGISIDQQSPGIGESVDRMELGDVDQDGRDEVILFSKNDNGDGNVQFTIYARGVLDDFTGENLGGPGTYIYEESNANTNAYALAVGNFDGRDVRFGDPEVVQCDYVQPTYIIGAIPSHFDVLDSVQYDLTQCYPAQECQMEVS